MANKGWLALEANMAPLQEASRAANGCLIMLEGWRKQYGPGNWLEGLVAARYRTTQRKDFSERIDTMEKGLAGLYDRTSETVVRISRMLDEKKTLKAEKKSAKTRKQKDELEDQIEAKEAAIDREIPGKRLRDRYRTVRAQSNVWMQFVQQMRKDFTHINTVILPKYADQVDDPGAITVNGLNHRTLSAVLIKNPEDKDFIETWLATFTTVQPKIALFITEIQKGAKDQKIEAPMTKEEREQRELARLEDRDAADQNPWELDPDEGADDIVSRAQKQIADRLNMQDERETRRREIEKGREVTPRKNLSMSERKLRDLEEDVQSIGKAVDEYSVGMLPPNVPFGVVRAPIILMGARFSEPALRQLESRFKMKVKDVGALGPKKSKDKYGLPTSGVSGTLMIPNALVFGWSNAAFKAKHGEKGDAEQLDPAAILDLIRNKVVETKKPKGGRDMNEKDMNRPYRRDEEEATEMEKNFNLPKGGDGTLVKRMNLQVVSKPKREGTHQYVILMPELKGLGRDRQRSDDIEIGDWGFASGRVANFVEAMATWTE